MKLKRNTVSLYDNKYATWLYTAACAFHSTGDHIQLQKKLLDPKLQTITPDVEFLELFSGVVGSKWSSLACLLSLTSEEIEEVKTEEEDQALLMLKKWSSKEGATYGQLCNKLKTISLFQYNAPKPKVLSSIPSTPTPAKKNTINIKKFLLVQLLLISFGCLLFFILYGYS